MPLMSLLTTVPSVTGTSDLLSLGAGLDHSDVDLTIPADGLLLVCTALSVFIM